MAMIRKQIYVEKKQDQLLKQFVKKLGLTEAEVIRRAIEFFAANQLILNENSRASRTGARAWQTFVKNTELSRQQALKSDAPVKWDRNALYEDRMLQLERRRAK
jgi:hypothetical protein